MTLLSLYICTGPFKTCLWLVLTAAMLAGLIYSLTGITSKYLSYPSSVGIAIKHANDVQFPAITVCNTSPIRASRYNEIVLGISLNRRKRSTPEGITHKSYSWMFLLQTTRLQPREWAKRFTLHWFAKRIHQNARHYVEATSYQILIKKHRTYIILVKNFYQQFLYCPQSGDLRLPHNTSSRARVN